MITMKDYSGPEYKDLYKEIIKDHNFRFGKFSPIPYPINPNPSNKNVINN